jgi:ribosomal protein L11 methyltransferase
MWLEIKVSLPEGLKEPVTAVLYEHGCQGITEEPGLLTAYFPKDARAESVKAALSGFEGVRATVNTVEEQDWYASWKKTFRPVHAAGLTICPPWSGSGPDPGERLLIIDPGQAFGTGDHITTSTVLELLREWAEGQEDLSRKRMLDLGTGSGILSIAAVFFGLKRIVAVDNEAKAIETAKENFRLNGVEGLIDLRLGSIEAAGMGYDFVAANIFRDVLIDVMPDTVKAMNPGGWLAASGMMEGQEVDVIRKAAECGLETAKVLPGNGWVSVLLRKS